MAGSQDRADPNIPMERWNEMSRHVRQGRSIREVLQVVEDTLVDAGYDQFAVWTEHGTFQWQTMERARVETLNDPGDELEH